MTDRCAPGSEWEEKKHRWWITWHDKTFKQMPRGAHSKRKRGGFGVEVRMGDVRALVRFLEIEPDCARHYFQEI